MVFCACVVLLFVTPQATHSLQARRNEALSAALQSKQARKKPAEGAPPKPNPVAPKDSWYDPKKPTETHWWQARAAEVLPGGVFESKLIPLKSFQPAPVLQPRLSGRIWTPATARAASRPRTYRSKLHRSKTNLESKGEKSGSETGSP